ncbi:protein kinase domain-containing protein [Tundrisphaera sp. TA3]|uniref:protein kinase domain-containing protein n=1 Tax=Tundrisphaera sp. TA3 TaxID=3435775 RepID=UPI003EB92349
MIASGHGPSCPNLSLPGSPLDLCPTCLMAIGLAAHDDTGDSAPSFEHRGPSATPLLVLEPIAHGGSARVYRARDQRLGRDLAIKVLRPPYRERPEMLRRFIAEARIIGTLQHPGIVPIYELGRCDDELPYIAMKLVEGQTLAEFMRPTPASEPERPRLLGVFLQVCRAVAYAHSRRVIHRDLKPSNILLGPFGEVHVTDWGLAKVLGEGGGPANIGSPGGQEAGAHDPAESRFGAVLGTPSYMSPEQASGDPCRIDERSDVFSLGSILCEILTGRPAYEGASSIEVLKRSAEGDLSGTIARLGASGADPGLVALACDCLEPDPSRRPPDASVVADRLQAYLDSVGERLRVAELARAKADARAAEEQARRRLTTALVVAVLSLLVTVGAGLGVVARRRQVNRDRVATALGRVEALRDAAKADPDGRPERWEVAMAAAREASDLLEQEADPGSLRRLRGISDEIGRGLDATRADAVLVRQLDRIRCHDGLVNLPAIDSDYRDAFRDAGIDLDSGDPEDIGRAVGRRPAITAKAIAAALDDWAIIRRQLAHRRPGVLDPGDAGWERPLLAARASDPDDWTNAVRDAFARQDEASLVRLASDPRLDARTATGLCLLGRVLTGATRGAREDLLAHSLAVLKSARRVYPDDFWINLTLAIRLQQADSADLRRQSLQFAAAAVAVRPKSAPAHVVLGRGLRENGDHEGAASELEAAVRLRPLDYYVRFNLGNNLLDRNQPERGEIELRESVRLKPDCGDCRVHLGYALAIQGKIEPAIEAYREVLRREPGYDYAQDMLRNLLVGLGRSEEAEALAREVARTRPGPAARVSLGEILRLADPASEEAEGEFKGALDLDPSNGDAAKGLVSVLLARGQASAAIAVLDDLAMGKVRDAGAVGRLARLRDLATRADAMHIPIAREEIPRDVDLCLDLAAVFRDRRDHDSAGRLFAAALEDHPELIEDHWHTVPFDAACNAVLAATTMEGDAPRIFAMREESRRKALGLLRADMETWRKQLDARTPQCRFHVARCIARWTSTRDLSSVRGSEALGRLSPSERREWEALWEDVRALSRRVGEIDFRDTK